jgi:hypothetical protein
MLISRIPVAAQEQMAAAADHVELLPSSHQPMASMPDKLAEALARVEGRARKGARRH